jgi:hypothetical protein
VQDIDGEHPLEQSPQAGLAGMFEPVVGEVPE